MGATLLVASGLRAAAIGQGLDPVFAGLAFAIVLLLASGAVPDLRRRPRFPGPAAIGLGALTGLLLLMPGTWLKLRGYPAHHGELTGFSLASWAPAVTVLAVAEETILRGVIQPRLRRLAGATSAIVATAILFAASHLPLYGVAALPLDLGVGLIFGVLREATRSVAACALAHAVADLGFWWLA
jgi:membrane protease YdiL (CAAX protease family)